MNALPVPPANTLAVIDTNVSLEVFSGHDVICTYERLHETAGEAAIDDPEMTCRLQRARESNLLAMYFNGIGATTFGLHNELVELMRKRVPRAPDGKGPMESDFATVFLYFVKEYVLPSWDDRTPADPGTEAGNHADRTYIAVAKQNGLPLITNEGYTQTGFADYKRGKPTMRKLARDEGVQVFSPREFYASKIDEERVGSPKPIPWRSGPLGSPGPAPVTSRSVRDNLPA